MADFFIEVTQMSRRAEKYAKMGAYVVSPLVVEASAVCVCVSAFGMFYAAYLILANNLHLFCMCTTGGMVDASIPYLELCTATNLCFSSDFQSKVVYDLKKALLFLFFPFGLCLAAPLVLFFMRHAFPYTKFFPRTSDSFVVRTFSPECHHCFVLAGLPRKFV